MENFIAEITPALLEFVATVVLALIGWATVKVKTYFDEKGVSEKLAQYDYLADLAVQGVEQLYRNENGEAKKEYAKVHFLELLADAGLQVTEMQLDIFLENAVKRMNDAWKA